MRAIIAIGSTDRPPKDLEQLPIFRIYETKEGEYIFLEKRVIEEAIALSLNKLKEGQLSVVLIEVQVVPISQRVRRGATPRRRRAQASDSSFRNKFGSRGLGNARRGGRR